MIRSSFFKVIMGVLIFVALGIMFVYAITIDKTTVYNENNNQNYQTKISVTLPEKIYVVNEAVVEWMDGTKTAKEIHDKYRDFGRLDYTNIVDFVYTIDNLPVESFVEKQEILIVDKEYSKQVYSKILSSEERSVSLENLRPSTTYSYSIKVTFSDNKVVEKNGEFTTETSPCFLFVNGARNVRDIGATKTIDGKQIKKYMLYRGSELDGAIEPKNVITEQGVDYMLNVLNIKSEIDLRWYDEKTMRDMLGSNIQHNYYRMLAYSEFFNTPYIIPSIKDVFSNLAMPETYPAYIHCTYGADQTGTIIYVLEALLGVGEETLYKEWETSIFCHGDAFYDEMDDFIKQFKSLKGDTMQEKAENYLLSIGVTRKEIESIREILLTD